MTSYEEFLRVVDSLIIELHHDYRREMVNTIEDLRHVHGQADDASRRKEHNLLLATLAEDIQIAADTGDVLCVLFAKYCLLGEIQTAAHLFALLVDYSTKDDASTYQRTLSKLLPFVRKS